MARIPDEVLERLKREVSVARLAESRGIALKKHGENLLGLCPFHADRDPSLVVTPPPGRVAVSNVPSGE